jgi:hypothetical protein
MCCLLWLLLSIVTACKDVNANVSKESKAVVRDFSLQVDPDVHASLSIGKGSAQDNPREQFYHGLRIVRKDSLFGFIDSDTNLVIACQYDEVSTFEYGAAQVVLAGKSGIIDPKGAYVVPLDTFDHLYGFREGLAVYRKEGEFGAYDLSGKKMVLSNQYQASGSRVWDGRLGVRKGNKWGFMDITGKLVIPADYDEIVDDGFSNGLACVSKGGKFGAINTSGEVVLRFEFDQAYDLWGNGKVTLVKGADERTAKAKYILDGSVQKFYDENDL